jgi:hypothetical protein
MAIRAMWPQTLEANFPEDRRDIRWDAHCILTQLVDTYSLDKERDKSQPPIPMTAAEKAAHKLFNFAASDERADTTISETCEAKVRRLAKNVLTTTNINGSVQVKKRDGCPALYTAGRISASHYIIISDEISVHTPIDEVLDSYIVQMPEAARSSKERRTELRRNRKGRKEDMVIMERQATRVTKTNWTKILLQNFQKEFPGFGYEAILRMITMAQGSYSEQVSIGDNGTQHEFNVALTGFDQNAASLNAQAALITLYADRKAGKKKKARRQKTSTKRGGDGVHLSWALKRSENQEDLDKFRSQEKKLKDNMTKSDDFSKQMASYMDSNPGTYWQVEIVKNGKPSQVTGKVLNLFCIMFSVKEKTADLKRQELKSKEIDQDSFDALVQGEEDKRAQWEKNLQEIKPKIDAILD